MTINIPSIEIEIGDNLFLYIEDLQFTPFKKGYISGRPEDCYEDEGAEVAAAFIAVGHPVEFDKGFLCQVLGIGAVAGRTIKEINQAVLPAFDQIGKSLPVAVRDRPQAQAVDVLKRGGLRARCGHRWCRDRFRPAGRLNRAGVRVHSYRGNRCPATKSCTFFGPGLAHSKM